ncbi:DUF2270 domain-containing protein [Halosimplex aquaticum]|uniref:DUF2270 domain-containing protein n=1 Tax=Halosimplex aquaticum TaxID=3026162 RepID=A0ABD5Y1D4_9EURY|nr:DUF2270 domain-containing protein [Halosimplex aquaticum]
MSDRSDSDDGNAETDLLAKFEESMPSLLGHFYRAEMDRSTAWRGRLDNTTNWAVTIMAALLTFVFSSSDNPHYLLLIGMVTVAVFHVIETRRYRAYDVWRSRVRLLEEDVFAPTVDPDGGFEHGDWRRALGEDLRRPALKTSFFEAYRRRLRRMYLPLLLVLLASWVARVTVFAPKGSVFENASIVNVPGTVVVGAVALFYAAAVVVALWPQDRESKGEFYERNQEGEWKDD